MRCISPLTVKHNGIRHTVPCGKCNFCLQSKQIDWSLRLRYEQKKTDYAHFLTLTYAPENLPINDVSGLPELRLRDLQLFKKRVRKELALKTDAQLRYYSVGEYGTLGDRPHYHSIMFNCHPQVIAKIDKLWDLGNVKVGTVTPQSIAYVTKYVINRNSDGSMCPVMKLLKTREPPFSVMSRRPGLGSGYVGVMAAWHHSDLKNYTLTDGVKTKLPRYWRDKIFPKYEITTDDSPDEVDKKLRANSLRESLSACSMAAQDDSYRSEVQRLSLLEPDPEAYMDEAMRWSHDSIFKKLNSKNKL